MIKEKILRESLLLLSEEATIPSDKFILRIQNLFKKIPKNALKNVIFRANLDSRDNLIDIDVIATGKNGKNQHITTIQDVFNGSTIENSLNKVEASFKLAEQFKPIFAKVKLQGMTRQTKIFFCYTDTTRGLNLSTNQWEKIVY